MSAFRSSAKGRLRPVKPLGAEVESLARDLGLDSGLKLHRLQIKWSALFHEGPLAFHTWPAHLTGGRLTVFADSPPWLQQVSFLKHEILSKLQPFGVSAVTFRIGRAKLENRGTYKKDTDAEISLSPKENEVIEEVVSGLKDNELKGYIRRAMRAWVRQKRRKGMEP